MSRTKYWREYKRQYRAAGRESKAMKAACASRYDRKNKTLIKIARILSRPIPEIRAELQR